MLQDIVLLFIPRISVYYDITSDLVALAIGLETTGLLEADKVRFFEEQNTTQHNESSPSSPITHSFVKCTPLLDPFREILQDQPAGSLPAR